MLSQIFVRPDSIIVRQLLLVEFCNTIGTYATFPDGGRKAGIGPKPDIAGLLSMLVYEVTPLVQRKAFRELSGQSVHDRGRKLPDRCQHAEGLVRTSG
jgi:hypothetical protein